MLFLRIVDMSLLCVSRQLDRIRPIRFDGPHNIRPPNRTLTCPTLFTVLLKRIHFRFILQMTRRIPASNLIHPNHISTQRTPDLNLILILIPTLIPAPTTDDAQPIPPTLPTRGEADTRTAANDPGVIEVFNLPAPPVINGTCDDIEIAYEYRCIGLSNEAMSFDPW